MLEVSSEDFRNKWGEYIEKVLAGTFLKIMRYKRPAFVVMPYAKYKDLESRAKLSDSPSVIEARNDANNSWVSQEEIDEIFADVRHPV